MEKKKAGITKKDILIIVLISITIRYLISLNGFSGRLVVTRFILGHAKPPMFGDMEAQRHWMEITVHLPRYDWYRDTPDNDLQYWGLDYPPLTAFHEYLMGLIVNRFFPAMVELQASRGIETDQSILVMRLSVILSDLMVFIPSCILFVTLLFKSHSRESQIHILLSLLLSPSLLLIDHAHFQYNSVCLGFVILSVTAIQLDWDCLGSFFFVMAIGYKQIALYYSLVFFIWLLRKCILKRSILHLIKIGITVTVSFFLLFLPFCIHLPSNLSPLQSLQAVITRMFPWNRWLFEDKVASFWCTLNNVVKLNTYFSFNQMKQLCLIGTLLSILPSLYLLTKCADLECVLYCLFECSIGFFLFSYHVHEKTILFPLIPLLLLDNQKDQNRSIKAFFELAASFSMIPLYIKDGTLLPAIAYILMFHVCLNTKTIVPFTSIKSLDSFLSVMILIGMTGVFLFYVVPPPSRYPDLHSVLISSFSFAVFSLFYLMILRMQYQAVSRD